MLPNFIGIGAQKSGTSTLFDLLKQHPNIYMPSFKEIHFFDRNDKYAKGLSWYENNFFSDVQEEKAIGEISPYYIYIDHVPKRIYDNLGENIKLISILRDPIDRAYSHYWMSYRRGYEKESFESAINLEKERIQKGKFEKSHFSYVDRGFYSEQIKRYLKYFPKENIKFIIFENFIKDIPGILKQIFNFLEVEPYSKVHYDIKSNPARLPRSTLLRDFMYQVSSKKMGKLLLPSKKIRRFITEAIHIINYKPIEKMQMKKDTRDKLIEVYKSEVKELEKLIGEDLRFWLKNNV